MIQSTDHMIVPQKQTELLLDMGLLISQDT